MRSAIAETLARTMIEQVFCPAKLQSRQGGEVERPRKILAQESIHVLDRAALPRCIRFGEVHRGLQPRGDGLVVGELLTVVDRQGAHRCRQRLQATRHRRGRYGRRLVAQPAQTGETRLALDKGQYTGTPAAPGERVAFPITETPAPCHDGGAFGNPDSSGNGAR